jgi:hypothetical protein
VGIRCADHETPLFAKVGTNFANTRRSLGRYSSLADQSHGVYFGFSINVAVPKRFKSVACIFNEIVNAVPLNACVKCESHSW